MPLQLQRQAAAGLASYPALLWDLVIPRAGDAEASVQTASHELLGDVGSLELRTQAWDPSAFRQLWVRFLQPGLFSVVPLQGLSRPLATPQHHFL